jgi:helicase
MDEIQKLVLETIEKDKQTIIFVPSRASAEKTAEDLSKKLNFYYPEFEKNVLQAASTPTKQCRRLSHCIKKGVAFHHAGLLQKQKDLIEDEFKSGKIKVICATPTLAAGLSLPVFRVIIKSLKRFSGRWGMDWIPVLEYMQMAGRAGRPEYEAFGEAICVAKNEIEKSEIYDRYICGEPEEIYSKLAAEPVLRTYLLSLISSGIIRDEKTLNDFFANTFWAQQFKDMKKLQDIIDRMLTMLEDWKFIVVERNGKKKDKDNDFISASSLVDSSSSSTSKKMRATMLGKRISELYLDPLTAKHLLDCLAKHEEINKINGNSNSNSKSSFSLLQMISHTLEMRPLLRIKSKQQDTIQEELLNNYDFLLEKEPSAFDLEYNEFMNSIKTTLFFEAWIDEKNEDYLFEQYNISPGEIRVKLENADWLLYASEEISKILEYRETIKDIRKLRVRIKNGVKEELLPLLKLKGVGRIRARKLFANGIKTPMDVKRMDQSSIGQLLGKKISEKVLTQLDVSIKQVSAGKRKGQMSLNKY